MKIMNAIPSNAYSVLLIVNMHNTKNVLGIAGWILNFKVKKKGRFYMLVFFFAF